MNFLRKETDYELDKFFKTDRFNYGAIFSRAAKLFCT